MMYNNLIIEYKKSNVSESDLLSLLNINENIYYNWALFGNIPASALIMLSAVYNCSIDYLLETNINIEFIRNEHELVSTPFKITFYKDKQLTQSQNLYKHSF